MEKKGEFFNLPRKKILFLEIGGGAKIQFLGQIITLAMDHLLPGDVALKSVHGSVALPTQHTQILPAPGILAL